MDPAKEKITYIVKSAKKQSDKLRKNDKESPSYQSKGEHEEFVSNNPMKGV